MPKPNAYVLDELQRLRVCVLLCTMNNQRGAVIPLLEAYACVKDYADAINALEEVFE